MGIAEHWINLPVVPLAEQLATNTTHLGELINKTSLTVKRGNYGCEHNQPDSTSSISTE